MNIMLAQMNIKAGKCEENFHTIQKVVENAKKQGVDMVVFPEMCICGYNVGDRLLNSDFLNDVHSYNDKMRELSENITLVFGNIYYDSTKHTVYNAAFIADNKQWVKKENENSVAVHAKYTNMNTGLKEESRYFTSGKEVNSKDVFLLEKNGKIFRMGLEIAEDITSLHAHYLEKDVDYIIHITNKAYVMNDVSFDETVKKYTNIKNHATCIHVNSCGLANTGKNFIVYDGGSGVFDSEGTRIFSLNDEFKEEFSIYDSHTLNVHPKTQNKTLKALVFAIQEVDKQMFGGKIKWIIGLSGGIDSCINAALLVMALGNERVIGYNLASTYNSDTTKNNARIVANNLGIEIREGSIEPIYKATIETMIDYKYEEEYPSLVYENIQARIRGHLLSTFSSIHNGIVINNGNKIEVALGYCTLYGDAIGVFAPLGDLTKVDCFEIARECNNYFNKEVISKTLIPELINGQIKWDMPPSAELKDEQFDPMKWYYHDELLNTLLMTNTTIEDILQSYLDATIYQTSLGKWISYYHLDNGKAFIEDIEWFIKTMSIATFKRIQMPPILKLSTKAFGTDNHEVQLGFIKTKRYDVLKSQILEIQ